MGGTHPPGRGTLPVPGGQQDVDHLRAGQVPPGGERDDHPVPIRRNNPGRWVPPAGRSRVHPTAVNAAARSLSDKGFRARKRRVRVIAAASVGRSSGPTAASTRAAARATVRCPAGTAPTGAGSSTARGRGGGQPQGGGDPDPAQVVVARRGRPGRLRDQRRRQREPAAGGPDGGDVVGDGAGGDVVPGGDLHQRTGRVVEQAVVVQHDPGPGRLQRPEHPVRQLGQHLRRGAARQRCSVTHPPTVPRLTARAGSTSHRIGRMFDSCRTMSVSEQRPERCPGGHVYVGGEYLVGWLPCGCTVGHTGHRTYWCQHCGHVLEIPPCLRIEVGTSEVLGIARPNWQFHPDPEP